MNINKRLFGTPIRGKVREKLEERQRLAAAPQPGESLESIDGVFKDNGKVVNELGSRTPFVRMWTSVKLIEPALVQEVLQEFEYIPGIPVYESNEVLEQDVADQTNLKKINDAKDEFLATLNFTPVVEKVEDANNPGSFKYLIKKPLTGPNGEELSPRDQVDYASKLYVVGDHNYQKNYGEVSTNDSLGYYAEDSVDSDLFDSSERQIGDRTVGEIAEGLFPQELKTNKFMKPQAGIMGASSTTEGTLGVIKRTTVSFIVHNFTDYDKIYNKYFLKPGATIFVDFGWSSLPELYSPQELVEMEDRTMEDYLYNATTGYVTKYNGDIEVIRGIVTDYNSKVLPNGSVECEVTLTSSNSALLGFSVEDDRVRTIKNILNYGILYLAIQPTLNQRGSGEESYRDSDLFKNTPNAYWSTSEIDTFNQNLLALAQKQIGSDDLVPSGNSIRTGVYINSYEIDDVYVSLGLFEDLIINSQFGFGKGVTDINNGTHGQIRLNSSNSFTTFKKFFLEKQRILDSSAEAAPVYLYPQVWGNDDSGIVASPGSEAGDVSRGDTFNGKNWVSTPVGKGSYSFQTGKYPFEQYLNTSQNPRGEEELGSDSFYLFDLDRDRIPVRELFISTDVIIDAFESQPNVRRAIADILDKINDESDGVLALHLSAGETDGEMAIIDINQNKTQNDIINSGDESTENEAFKDLFTFNVMSPNSIIKDYNLSFKIPTGNIGNMYAIQGASHSSKVFPISKDLDEALAMNAVDDDNLSIVYEPDLGSFRTKQLSARKSQDSSLINVYQNAKQLIENKTYTPAAQQSSENILPGTLETEIWQDDGISIRSENYSGLSDDAKEKLKNQRIMEANISKQEALGFRVVSDFREYFRLREIKEIIMKQRSNLLPYNLSLTTYGIGSVVPGDTFRVDYLPKIHLDNTYAQTMKVSHDINQDGWYTTIDTQFRIRPSIKKGSYVDVDITDARLSPKALDQLKLLSWHQEDPAQKGQYVIGKQDDFIRPDSNGLLPGERVGTQDVTIDSSKALPKKSVKELYPFMSGIKILSPPDEGYEHLSMILFFTWTGEEKQIFFPQDNFASHASEKFVDYSAVDKLSWLADREDIVGIETFLEGLLDIGTTAEGERPQSNADANADSYSKWLNFPTAFEFGGYVSRADFYNPNGDFMFDVGLESDQKASYATDYNLVSVLSSDYFEESVFERLMKAYGLGRINEDGTVNDELMYEGYHQITLEKNKSYYWYINGRYWAMHEAGDYQNVTAEEEAQLIQDYSNYKYYDKLVEPVKLDKTQCVSWYYNNVIGSKYQAETNVDQSGVNLQTLVTTAGGFGTVNLYNDVFSNTQYRCPDPVPAGEDIPPLYSDLAYCNSQCEANCEVVE
jgi:hypothetical protein